MLKITAFIFGTAMTIGCAYADSVVATRTIRSQVILNASDLKLVRNDEIQLTSITDLIGMETRVVLYQGRSVTVTDVGHPAVIERNQIVKLNFRAGGLNISVDGRALGRAGVGDQLKVMNLTSKSAVIGIVAANGSVLISQSN